MNRKKTLAIVMIIVVAVSLGLAVYFTDLRGQISVEFVQSFPDKQIFEQNATQYQFHILVSRQTTWTTPFGTTYAQMAKSLQPLISKYNLVPVTDEGITRPVFEGVFIQIGESTFSLFSYDTLSTEQIKSLAIDLQDAIADAPHY